jgi:hypothetical protein
MGVLPGGLFMILQAHKLEQDNNILTFHGLARSVLGPRTADNKPARD